MQKVKTIVFEWMNRENVHSLLINIPSDSAIGSELIDSLLAILERLSWSKDSIFAINLATVEALTNAIKHGNNYDQTKKVTASFLVSRDEAIVCFTDEGKGFDLQRIPDPTTDENLEQPSGRGIMLMNYFMDTVKFLNRGNQVQMTKQRKR